MSQNQNNWILALREQLKHGSHVWATVVDGDISTIYGSESAAQSEVEWWKRRGGRCRNVSVLRMPVYSSELAHERWKPR